jgi:hypothetical protein
VVDEHAALKLAESVLADWTTSVDPDEELVVWKIDEHPRVWIAYFASRRWVRTRDILDQLVGACPFVIEKVSGELHVYGSGPDGYAKFKAWLDEADPA